MTSFNFHHECCLIKDYVMIIFINELVFFFRGGGKVAFLPRTTRGSVFAASVAVWVGKPGWKTVEFLACGWESVEILVRAPRRFERARTEASYFLFAITRSR